MSGAIILSPLGPNPHSGPAPLTVVRPVVLASRGAFPFWCERAKGAGLHSTVSRHLEEARTL